jgi:hemerythrin
MPILLWDTEFEVGIGQFDQHHKHLINLLNETNNAFTAGAGRGKIGNALDTLIGCATCHLKAEELFMQEHKYKGLQQHYGEHSQFTLRVIEIQTDFHSGKIDLSHEILSFMNNWITTHILKTDTEFGRFGP